MDHSDLQFNFEGMDYESVRQILKDENPNCQIIRIDKEDASHTTLPTGNKPDRVTLVVNRVGRILKSSRG